ncbi:MAG: FAD-binding oxidoreductase [Planctomycetes bacterium]|nr:FAD-binding oxidoreductase [Planctomycetota bacterium]
MDNGLTFDGTTRFPIVSPSSVEELSALVRQAASEKNGLYPFGGRTMIDLGLPPVKPGYVVDMRQLNQVIDYPARDMTITVQAGITIAKLREILKAEKQQLPVDVPLPDQATLGGAIAANASGPRRYGLGTLRDYVIGISAVNDAGEEIKAGGRVVKNVAGYDLMKLFTGSLGTLVIITQVTLKLKPITDSAVWHAFAVLPARLGASLDRLHASKTRPVALDYLDPAASRELAGSGKLKLPAHDGTSGNLIVGFEDNFKAVTWQNETLRQENQLERSAVREYTGIEQTNLLACLTDFQLWPEAAFTFKANIVSSTVAEFCQRAASLQPQPLVQAHAGNGIIHGHVKDLTLDQARSMLETLGGVVAKVNGNLVVTRCPAGWKKDLPIWGRPTDDRVLMKAIKDKLDPGGIFNPGRFVDGI